MRFNMILFCDNKFLIVFCSNVETNSFETNALGWVTSFLILIFNLLDRIVWNIYIIIVLMFLIRFYNIKSVNLMVMEGLIFRNCIAEDGSKMNWNVVFSIFFNKDLRLRINTITLTLYPDFWIFCLWSMFNCLVISQFSLIFKFDRICRYRSNLGSIYFKILYEIAFFFNNM